jgi:hypothetical protein
MQVFILLIFIYDNHLKFMNYFKNTPLNTLIGDFLLDNPTFLLLDMA